MCVFISPAVLTEILKLSFIQVVMVAHSIEARCAALWVFVLSYIIC